MFRYFFIAYFLFLITYSCGRKADTDLSLKEKQYMELGMPDPSKNWKLTDYRLSQVVLSQLKSEKPKSLPRKESNRSGRVFARLINRENLSFLQDSSLPLQEKALQIQSYIMVHNDLIDIYTDFYRSEQYYHRELIDLYIFGLQIMRKMFQLSAVINESDNIETSRLKSGLPTLKLTYVSLVSYLLDNQKHASTYQTHDLERLADSLYQSVKTNSSWMDTATRENLEQKIRNVMDSVPSGHIHDKYNDLITIFSTDDGK